MSSSARYVLDTNTLVNTVLFEHSTPKPDGTRLAQSCRGDPCDRPQKGRKQWGEYKIRPYQRRGAVSQCHAFWFSRFTRYKNMLWIKYCHPSARVDSEIKYYGLAALDQKVLEQTVIVGSNG